MHVLDSFQLASSLTANTPPAAPNSNCTITNNNNNDVPRVRCEVSATGKLGRFCSELGSSYEGRIGYDVEDLTIEVLVRVARSATSKQRALARL